MPDNNMNVMTPPFMEQPPKKNKRGIIILFVLVVLLGVGGYIGYNKLTSKPEPKKEEEKKEEKQPETIEDDQVFKINNINDLEKVKLENVNYSYWNYNDLAKYYLGMDKSYDLEKGINIDSQYVNYIKVEDGELYWFVNSSWIKEARIDEKINFLLIRDDANAAVFELIAISENKVFVFALNHELGISSEPSMDNNNLFNQAYSEFKFLTYSTKGDISNVQIKYICECECVPVYYLKVGVDIYALSVYSEVDKIELQPLKDRIESFESYNKTCGNNPYSLGRDGSLVNLFSDMNRIKIKDYIRFDFGNINALIIDEKNFLYTL